MVMSKKGGGKPDCAQQLKDASRDSGRWPKIERQFSLQLLRRFAHLAQLPIRGTGLPEQAIFLEILMRSRLTAVAAFILVSFAGATVAQTAVIEIKNAWVRTAVPGQSATGAFMTITHKDGARLVRGASPIAGVTEIHEMKMEGDVMKMRALPQGVDLPAGRAVDLAPGGYHIMLMDLKGALPKDSVVPITLWFKDAKGVESQLELKLPVAARAPDGKAAGAMSEHKH